jgi:hypothetical protein
MKFRNAGGEGVPGLVTGARAGGRHVRDQRHRGDQRDHGDRHDRQERAAPAEGLADQRAQRHAERRRHRDTGDDDPDRLAHALRRDDRHARDEGGRDEQALQRTDEDAYREEHAVVGGQHGDQVARDEQRERADEDDLPVQPDRQRGQHRAADGQAQRVRGHQGAGRGDGHPEVGGDQVQHADHEQLAAAQHEHSQEQGGQREVRPRPARDHLWGAHVHLPT